MNIRFPWQARTIDQEFSVAAQADRDGKKSKAEAGFRRVLTLDPSHTEARAALGRLQYVAPPTPVLDRTKKLAGPLVCEVMIEIRNPCNFRCFYCVAKGHNNTPVQPLDIEKITQHYEALKGRPIITVFECGGGEPTVHPQFKDLLQMCAERGGVSFPTNNSQDPKRWLPRNVAARLSIRSTLHPEAEEKFDRYLTYARTIIDAGALFTGLFVVHPTRIQRALELKNIFAAENIRFQLTPFIGEHDGKPYPHSYTDTERELFESDSSWYQQIQPHVNRIRNFRGIPCLAGHTALYITGSGTLRRCTYDLRPIKKPHDQPQPCGVKSCGCGMYLDKLNKNSMGSDYQFWQTLVEPNVKKADLASAATGEDWNWLIAEEQRAIYDALMSAYAKDEIPEP